MKNLSDATAVITGAGSGIGRALAKELAARGARLALADVDGEGLEATRQTLEAARAKAYTVDVSKAEAVEAFARQVEEDFGGASLLVNNAGVALHGTFAEVSLADMEWLMRVNFWGVVHGCKFFLPLLEREREAHIVNLSSIFGLIGPSGQAAYSASKFAVRGFTEVLRQELSDTNIKVSCVYPGGTRTPLARNGRAGELSQPQANAANIERFERWAKTGPETAARAIVKGIVADKPRIVVGADASYVDLIQRLLPAKATSIITALGNRRIPASTNTPAKE